MHRPIQALHVGLLLLLALAVLPLQASAHVGTADEEPEAPPYHYYLPDVYRDVKFTPDLVVEAITVNSDSAIVVIKNQGHVPVEAGEPFWVDLYVAPDPMPAGPNEVWDSSCSHGIVWAIQPAALPLQAGETLTMTLCPEQEEPDPFYSPDFSSFDVALAPGTPVAVQVDSANMDTTYGGVLEAHEVFSTTYNNISTTVSIAGSGCGTALRARPSVLLPLAQHDGLPLRPNHAD